MSKLVEIRLIYETKVNNTVPKPTFDPRDHDKVKTDIYLHRVLEHCQNNIQQAAEMLYNIMEWRKEHKINDISEANVDLNILNEGLYFTRGRDIDSCLLFIMNSKAYVKNQNDLDAVKKVFIYWLERLEREEGGKKVTLFFDMDGCGINNMNLNLFTYMIQVLKSYYPNFINYIIIFQMPWILSAGFRIVKEMLPGPAVNRLRIINKNKLKDLVAPEQSLVSWGGKDNYKFEFVPENRQNPSNNDTEDDNYSIGEMLKLRPPKVLTFQNVGNKIFSTLLLTNMDEGIIAFKIRTTSPIRYTVRPNHGILPQRNTKNIEISLQPGFHLDSIENDRFLIVSVNVPKLDMSQTEMIEIWKTARSNTDEYRLTCTIKEQKVTVSKIERNAIAEITTSMDEEYKIILNNFNVIHKYQFIILVLIVTGVFINLLVLIKLNKQN